MNYCCVELQIYMYVCVCVRARACVRERERERDVIGEVASLNLTCSYKMQFFSCLKLHRQFLHVVKYFIMCW